MAQPTKKCSKCNKKFPATLEYFYYRKTGKIHLQSHCKKCVSKYESNRVRDKKQCPIYARNRHLVIKYNLTIEDYNNILEQQNNACAICKDGDKKLVVDHCHSTGKVRGLLCHNCNVALGMFKDNQEILDRAKEYLL